MDSKSQKKIIDRHGPLVSSSQIHPKNVNTKGNFSVEDSGPPSPHSGTVSNFGEVAPGIYRSSFPYPENLEHLRSLRLKTIVTCVDTEHSPEFNEYVEEGGIQHHRILVPAHKSASVVIPIETVLGIQAILLDSSNYPLLIHCNKGKHRTGCMIACYRKFHGWQNASIVTEYRKYAGAKFRPLDEAFITTFNADLAAKMLRGKKDVIYHSLPPTQSMIPTPPASEKSVDGDEDILVDQSDAWGMRHGADLDALTGAGFLCW